MKIITVNRKAFFDYSIIEKHTAGIKLQGSEVKSVRNNDVSINEAYCFIQDGEVYIKGMHISEYKQSGYLANHQPIKDRKLLMKKKEILKLFENLTQKGLTLIPLKLMFSDSGFIKIEIGLCKGKKNYDKSKAIKEKDIKRDIERNS